MILSDDILYGKNIIIRMQSAITTIMIEISDPLVI